VSEDLKNLSEIIELCQEEMNKNDENITAILDLQDLKSLKNIVNDYKRQVEINKEHQKTNGELQQKVKQLEEADLTTIYLNGVYDGKDKVNEKLKEKVKELEKEDEYGGRSYSTRDVIYILQEILKKG